MFRHDFKVDSAGRYFISLLLHIALILSHHVGLESRKNKGVAGTRNFHLWFINNKLSDAVLQVAHIEVSNGALFSNDA
jgi:hypothetical protein